MFAMLRCLAQLAMHEQGKTALLADPSVCAALEALANSDAAFSEAARNFASAALMALNDKGLDQSTDGQKHVMLSCACINPMLHLSM